MLKLFICLLSGGAVGATLLFPDLGPLVFFLAVPFFVILMKGNVKFKLCFAFCLGICLAGYFPAFYIRPGFGPVITFLIDLLVYSAVDLLHSLILAFALWSGLTLTKKEWLKCIYTPLLWAMAEWVIGSGTFAWPTLRLSLSLWKYPALIQWASVGGQLLVSAIIVAINMLFALSLYHIKNRRAIFSAIAAALVFTVNILPCAFTHSKEDKKINAVLVQPGVTVVGEDRGDVYIRALELSEKAAELKPDIILVSESVLPFSFEEDEYLKKEWADIAKSAQADVIIGGRLNGHAAAFHFNPNGELEAIAPKRREVPLFENGVGDRKFRPFPDNTPNILATEKADMGLMICYESMFSVISRNAARDGTALLSVITNDSWFDHDTAKNLHLSHGVFRAVETGRALIQSGINGRTAAINKNGKVTAIIENSGGEILQAQVSVTAKNTPYLLWGDLWLAVCSAIIVIMKRGW